MSIRDRKCEKDEGFVQLVIPLFRAGQIAADATDLEILATRLPADTDWYLKSAHVWVKATSGSNALTVNVQDDGTDKLTDTTVVAGAQTAITGASGKTFKGGSEVQVTVTTGATTTITDICVTLVFEPLYLYSRVATPTPS